jgi:hypothetical protein
MLPALINDAPIRWSSGYKLDGCGSDTLWRASPPPIAWAIRPYAPIWDPATSHWGGGDKFDGMLKKIQKAFMSSAQPIERRGMVAPARFELTSQDPESRMIDRYTTGLC